SGSWSTRRSFLRSSWRYRGSSLDGGTHEASGGGAHRLACPVILTGLTLGNAHRMSGDLAVAELAEGDGRAQHAVHRVVAASGKQRGHGGLPGAGGPLAAKPGAGGETPGGVTDVDHRLPRPAAKR